MDNFASCCLALGSAVLGLHSPMAPEQKLQRLEVEQSAGAGSLRGSCWQPRVAGRTLGAGM